MFEISSYILDWNIVGNENVEQAMWDLQDPSILLGCMAAPRSPVHMEFYFKMK